MKHLIVGDVRSLFLLALFVACESSSPPPHVLPADAATESIEGCGGCNPLIQTGCNVGEKCTWIQDTTTTGHVCCSPIGHAATGQACNTVLTGGDSCGKGDVCIDSVCRSICDHRRNEPTCDASTTCTVIEHVFIEGTNQIAGVCLP